MTMPPVGVRPIVVSTDRPSRTAHRLAPLPRWAIDRPAQPFSAHVARRRTRTRGRGSRSGARRRARAARAAPEGGLLRDRVVEGRVEARHLGHAGERRPPLPSMPAMAAGWCSGASGIERPAGREEGVVDRRRADVVGSAVHHPVADGVGLGEPGGPDRGERLVEAGAVLRPSATARARPRVAGRPTNTATLTDDEPALTHRTYGGRGHAGQVQSRISGMSSRCSRT